MPLQIFYIRVSKYICNIKSLGMNSYANAFYITQVIYIVYSNYLHLILLICQEATEKLRQYDVIDVMSVRLVSLSHCVVVVTCVVGNVWNIYGET